MDPALKVVLARSVEIENGLAERATELPQERPMKVNALLPSGP
jgi:hypothetical protein